MSKKLFETGNKIGKGRPKGALNKTTIIPKEYIVEIGVEAFTSGKVAKELNSLTGKEYIEALAKLLQYVIPKPTQSVDLESNAPFQIFLTSPIKSDE